MQILNARFKKSGALTLVAVLGLLMTSVSPASADPLVAAGAGGGWEYPPPDEQIQPCTNVGGPTDTPFAAHFQQDTFILAHYGDWVATTPDAGAQMPVANYLGQTTTVIEVGPHYVSPLGTHSDEPGSPTECPTAVPGTVAITDIDITGEAAFTTIPPFPIGGSTTGFVDCHGSEGIYTRVSEVVVFTALVDCVVKGNVVGTVIPPIDTPTVAVDDVRVVIEGEMTPCLLLPPFDIVQNPQCGIGPDGAEAGSRLDTALEAVGPSPV